MKTQKLNTKRGKIKTTPFNDKEKLILFIGIGIGIGVTLYNLTK